MRNTLLLYIMSLLSAAAWGQSYTYRYWTDNDVAAAKTGSATGEAQFSVNTASLSTGYHALHVQARNADGVWSGVRTRYFLIDRSEHQSATTARYWIDNDMTTMHNGVATSGIIDIDVTTLTVGIHSIHYQTFAADGTPSPARTRYLLVENVHRGILKAIVRIDGGTPTTYALSDDDIVMDIGELPNGKHTLSVTLIDMAGNVYGTKESTFANYGDPVLSLEKLTVEGSLLEREDNTVTAVVKNEGGPFEGTLGLYYIYEGEEDVYVMGTVDTAIAPEGTETYNFNFRTLFGGTYHLWLASADDPLTPIGKSLSVEITHPIRIIEFADALTKSICVTNWDTNGDNELDTDEAAAVERIGTVFNNTDITSFDELQYFTGLETLEDWEFYECKKLTSVVFPYSVYYVKGGIFSYCDELTSVSVDPDNEWLDSRGDCNAVIKTETGILLAGCKTTIIPEDVTAIDFAAFHHCHGLEKLTIPQSITSIEYAGLFGCMDLKEIVIPRTVTAIGGEAFGNCTDLEKMTVEEGNPVYDSRDNCNAVIETATNTLVSSCLTTVIPLTVKTIGECAFDCIPIISINIPASVETIAKQAVRNCNSLAYLTVDKGNAVYDSRGCNAVMETATNTLLIGSKNTVIPSATKSIGDYAFYGLNDLASVWIPNGVTSLGEGAFYGCKDLEKVTIPASVTSIGDEAFNECKKLVSVTAAMVTPPAITENTFTSRQYATLYVPLGKSSLYNGAAWWQDFYRIVEIDTNAVGMDAITRNEGDAEPVYNLQGQRINTSQMKRGLYIVNGKKTVIR